MDQIDNQQIDKLLNDISTIKNVLSRNRGLLQKMLLPAHFRILWYACGFGFIFFCLLFYFLIQYFGKYGDIPLLFKAVIYIAMVLYLFFMAYIKWSTLLSSAKQIDPKMTFGRVLKEFFIFRVRHIVFPIVFLYAFFIIFFICIGKAYYIIPTILMAIGLIFNFIGSITGIRQYLIAGYWFLITGILSVIFNAIPPLLVIAVSFGCGLLVFAVSTSFSTGVDMEV
ncbi:MAG: hypothetical protein KKF30_03475 [Proteobacteria bacterium]|nr:hypothetical protein [Pseudomonadota bacterium]MBU4470118.1 hypothetical protein [Pseudomonadota bacterium]MCG2753102.1 hypothetical protein [Desulfobacteraceae bacterium]